MAATRRSSVKTTRDDGAGGASNVGKPPSGRTTKRTPTGAPATSIAPAGVELRPKLTSVRVSSEDLVHYVNNFGRHDAYAGGEQIRPLMRGWVHFTSILVALTGRALGYHESLPERATLFIQCTLLTYLFSVTLHMVPWKTALGYDVSLALDFIGISWGFTSHSILWTGGVHGVSQIGAVATFACMCLMQIAAFTSKEKRVLHFMRRRRLTLILLNIIFLAVVETRAIRDVRWMLAIQFLSKIVSPAYFMLCTRFDAKRKSRFEIQGVWGPHETWHVLILIVHLMQLYVVVQQENGLM
jgi:hypothetical protein